MQVRGGKEVTLTPGQTFYEGRTTRTRWAAMQPHRASEVHGPVDQDKGAEVMFARVAKSLAAGSRARRNALRRSCVRPAGSPSAVKSSTTAECSRSRDVSSVSLIQHRRRTGSSSTHCQPQPAQVAIITSQRR
jgi:hypothetical protein